MLFEELLQGDLVDLHIFLAHHFLKRFKVIHGQYLLHDAVMGGVGSTRLTRSLELLSRDTHLGDQLAQQFVDKFEKVLFLATN